MHCRHLAGTLLQLARGATVPRVAQTAQHLLRIPGRGVHSASLVCNQPHREAVTAVVAAIGTSGALARQSIVVGEALAEASTAVTYALHQSDY